MITDRAHGAEVLVFGACGQVDAACCEESAEALGGVERAFFGELGARTEYEVVLIEGGNQVVKVCGIIGEVSIEEGDRIGGGVGFGFDPIEGGEAGSAVASFIFSNDDGSSLSGEFDGIIG